MCVCVCFCWPMTLPRSDLAQRRRCVDEACWQLTGNHKKKRRPQIGKEPKLESGRQTEERKSKVHADNLSRVYPRSSFVHLQSTPAFFIDRNAAWDLPRATRKGYFYTFYTPCVTTNMHFQGCHYNFKSRSLQKRKPWVIFWKVNTKRKQSPQAAETDSLPLAEKTTCYAPSVKTWCVFPH